MKEPEEILFDSWHDAEAHLGINLIDNSLFTAEDTRLMAAWGKPGKHCHGLYYVWDEQFTGAKIGTTFQRSGIKFGVSAMVMAEYAAVYDDIVRAYYYGHSITYPQYPLREVTVSTEEYVTEAGIPILLVIVTREAKNSSPYDNLLHCSAFFAVNHISYCVEVSDRTFDPIDLKNYANMAEKVVAEMKEVLEGFTLE
jgi:hypothetical protein